MELRVRAAGSVRQDEVLNAAIREQPDASGDLFRGMPFVQMGTTLRVNHFALADHAECELSRVSRDSDRRQLGELRVRDALLEGDALNERV